MTKLHKLLQCISLRRMILGKIGKGNKFRPGCMSTSAAVIGNNNYFGDRCMIGNAQIGNYCSFGPDVKVGQAQHSIEYLTTYQKISSKNINYSLNRKKAKIGNDVWLGANVVVMQEVTIGDGAVIGANAVVTKDIPAYAIAIGIPAKVIRYRFDENLINRLKSSKWTDMPFDQACTTLQSIQKEIDVYK